MLFDSAPAAGQVELRQRLQLAKLGRQRRQAVAAGQDELLQRPQLTHRRGQRLHIPARLSIELLSVSDKEKPF